MKAIVITGATDGIGLQTAEQLLAESIHLIVHGRTERKASDVATDLKQLNPATSITPVWGDFSNMTEVGSLAEQILALGSPIDCLINNAGTYAKQQTITVDGFERTMAVNYFAAFLLTKRLMPALEASPKARIVNVSSMTHDGAKINPLDLNFSRRWSGYDAYASSKLANVLFTMALAEKTKQSNISANVLHPGVVSTKLLRNAFSMSGISAAEGAKTSVYLASDPAVATVSGAYFVNCKRAKPSELAFDSALVKSLWRETEKLLASFY